MLGIIPHSAQMPGFNYYLHVDPANGGDRYVAVLVAKEFYTNHQGRRRIRVHLANIWIWEPDPLMGLQFNKIDKEVVMLCSKYNPIAVTYDQWNSIHSLQLLRSHGRNCIQTAFNRSYKQKIYQNLYNMMSYMPDPELALYEGDPNSNLLAGELKAIKKRPTGRGITLVKDKDGDIQTDDLADCLAGATAMAAESVRMSLPQPVVVNTGFR